MLKGQDIILLILLRLNPKTAWTFESISAILGISASQCHAAQKRLKLAGLVGINPESPWHVSGTSCSELIIHSIKYFFPPKIGSVSRGIPTAHSAEFVAKNFTSEIDNQNNFVWRHPEGTIRGNSLEPIHSSQLKFIPINSNFNELQKSMYEVLVCIDLLRVGRAREKNWAIDFLKKKFSNES